MTDPTISIDPALLAEFIDESIEMLDSLDSQFVLLEANPTDVPIIEAIFRPVHSIKGNSGFFGFVRVKNLAHELENLLDMARKGQLLIDQNITNVLLEGMDALKVIFDRVRESKSEIADEQPYNELIERVRNAGKEISPTQTLEQIHQQITLVIQKLGDPNLNLSDELHAIANHVAKTISDAGGDDLNASQAESPKEVLVIQEILVAPIEGTLDAESCDQVEKALQALVEAKYPTEADEIAKDMLETYETFYATVGFDSLLQDVILEKIDQLVKLLPAKFDEDKTAAETPATEKTKAASSTTAAAATPSEPSQKTAQKAVKKHDASKTMRIPESHIDTFLEYVGELLVVGDMFNNIQQQLGNAKLDHAIYETLKHANNTFSSLSDSLQKSIMSIRKVSMSALLQKVPRLVRDVAAKSNKQIQVNIFGEETQIDKSLVGLFDAPLTHMVRNAADHGIESPEERIAAGKDPKGTVTVGIEELGNYIVLTIVDDGAGLNLELIKNKAISMGLLAPDQKLGREELINFIFSSGVSTAEIITDVSGRGVGMDVVRRMIEDAGGSIDVKTETGKGSTFTIEVPKGVTTQIMSGYLISVADQRFVLPMSKVRETARVDSDEIKSITDKGRCVVRHDRVLPLLSLKAILGLAPSEQVDEQPIIVVIEVAGKDIAVCVDEVLGVQQVVLREIGGLDGQCEIIAGGALMGDGSVALVIDVDLMAKQDNTLAEMW